MADSITGDPPGGPALSCRMQWRNKSGTLGYELNSVASIGKGLITIVDSTHYEFDIEPQELPLDAGEWYWDFETFETDDCTGPSRTFYKGTTIVNKDISHDD